MQKKANKGQAAMEFLSTYGWVIFVLLAVIVALTYFGVLSLDRFLPNNCRLAPGLACEDFSITEDELSIAIKNGLSRQVNITGLLAPTCNTTTAMVLAKGEIGSVTFTECDNGNIGDAYNEEFNISYILDQLTHLESGEIRGVVEPGILGGTNQSDTTAPIISNIAPSNGSTVQTTDVGFSFVTNEPSDCEYSTTETFAYGSGTDVSTTGGTAHSMTLTLAEGGHSYYFKCEDQSSNQNSNGNQGRTTFTVTQPTINLSAYGYYRNVTFTEDRGIPRNNPFSFSFLHNNHVQADCDDVRVVTTGGVEVASNIMTCDASNVTVSIDLTLTGSETENYLVYYDNTLDTAPSYRTDGSEPLAGRIIAAGISVSCQCSSSKSNEVYSAMYNWVEPSGSGTIVCGSGELCNNIDVILPNIHAGTSYTYSADDLSSNALVTSGSKNYDIVITGYRWNVAGDRPQSDYTEFLQLGGNVILTGNDLSEFSTSFLPDGYNVDIGNNQFDCNAFTCSSSAPSHPLGDASFCGDWGYSCQTMNTISGQVSDRYFQIWSTASSNATMVVAGLDTPYLLDVTVGSETVNS